MLHEKRWRRKKEDNGNKKEGEEGKDVYERIINCSTLHRGGRENRNERTDNEMILFIVW